MGLDVPREGMHLTILDVLAQIAWSAGYYIALIVLIRVTGKRLAGQTTTFDLIVLIAIAVALQTIALAEGRIAAAIFVVVVLGMHLLQTALSARWAWFRRLLRGSPRALVRDGTIDRAALADEHLSTDDLLAALRKQGVEEVAAVHLAMLEETGQVSVVKR